MYDKNSLRRRSVLKGIGSSLAGGVALTTMSGTAAASSTDDTQFKTFISGNLDYSWEDKARNALKDNWDNQIGYGYSVSSMPQVTESEIEPYIDTSKEYTIFDAFRNWAQDNGYADTSQGALNIFLVDVRSGKWADWHGCNCGGVSYPGDWISGEFSTPNNYLTDGDEKSWKRSMTHEVGHACMDNELTHHSMGDEYPNGTDYQSTTMGAGSCSASYSGDPPRNAHGYGNDTISAIREYLETQSYPSGFDCCKYDSCLNA